MLTDAARRRVQRGTAGLYCAAAAAIVILVIPPISRNTLDGARPVVNSIAFGINAALNGVLALLALRGRQGVRVWVGIAGLIIGLILLDPAFDFSSRSVLRFAVAGMFAAAFCDFTAAVLVFAMAMLRARGDAKPIRLFN
jgi:hypothetical protein